MTAESLYGRTDGGSRTSEDVRRTAVDGAVRRLAANADFREWLYHTLDDLCAFARDEGVLTDFGQGIRAAAAHVERGLLGTAEGTAMLADLARREIDERHAEIVAGTKHERDGNDNERQVLE